MSGILEGLRVVEVSAFVAAPLGGMTLAQMGAEVIRIDLPHGGLDCHRWPVTAEGVSLFWCGLNKGKRSVCIDYSRPEGRELAAALVTAPQAEGGILLTNMAPRGWLSYEALRARREDLIQVTIMGKRDGTSALDYTVNASMGLPFMTGPAGHEGPVNHVLPAWDLLAGQMAATAVLAAERHRHRTGRGQHVTVALEDVALAAMGNLGFIAEAQRGQVRERCGNFLYGALGADFTCADGRRLMIVALTAKQWSALCEALELENDIAALQRALGIDLALEGNRYRAREEIAALVRSRIAARRFEEAAAALERSGACFSPYQTVSELVSADPACSIANPLFGLISQPGVGELLTPKLPLNFAADLAMPALAAPQLGQDTAEVLRRVIGLANAELERLRDAGIIGAVPPAA